MCLTRERLLWAGFVLYSGAGLAFLLSPGVPRVVAIGVLVAGLLLGWFLLFPPLLLAFLEAVFAFLGSCFKFGDFPEHVPSAYASMPCHCGGTITVPAEGSDNSCVRCGCVLKHNASGVGEFRCAAGLREERFEKWKRRGPGRSETEERFLAALVADPADLETRAVYADWLEEAGDPRADYLRAECELASLAPDDHRRGAARGRVSGSRERLRVQWQEWLELVGRPEA